MFEWDEGNTPHVLEHQVTPQQIEEAVLDPYALPPVLSGIVRGEIRYTTIGASVHGTVIVVVFTERHSNIRVITAYPARGAKLHRYMRGLS